LEDISVKVDIIIPADIIQFRSIYSKGDYDLVLAGWIDLTGDPDYTLKSLLSGKHNVYNLSRWYNEQFDEKLKAAQQLPFGDVQGRIKLYNEAQKIFLDEVPLIPLFHTKIFLVHNRRVRGVILYPSSMISYHKARLED